MDIEKPTRVQKVVIKSFGGGSDYSNIQTEYENYPTIKDPNEVIVHIKAVGLNFSDLLQRQGFNSSKHKPPYTPGYEGSGIVNELGSSVTEFKVGDRVMVFNTHGIWKEVVCLTKTNLVKFPNDMSFEEAAGLPIIYLTAYHILFEFGHLRPGNKILIHMAAGGVGTAAIQLCKTVENVTIFGTASVEKHDKLKEYGVDYPIDYKNKDYVDEVRKISPDGVDIVLDPLNGKDSISGYQLLRPFGRIIHYGVATMTTESRSLLSIAKTWWKCLRVNALDIISQNKSVNGYHLGYLMADPKCLPRVLEDLKKLIEMHQKGEIKVCIDTKYPFSRIDDAMHRMHSRKNIGKIILVPDSEYSE